MGQIYQKVAADRTLILDPREFLTRQFDFGEWTEMRTGFYLSYVKAGAGNENAEHDNLAPTEENVTISSNDDLITFGLKNSDTDDLPGFSGASFLGVANRTGQVSRITRDGSLNVVTSAGQELCAQGRVGATLIGGTVTELSNYVAGGVLSAPTTAYCGFFGMKFVILNRGLATQSVKISTVVTPSIAGATYTPSALRTLINNATYSTERTIAWNDGVAARPIPDSFWVRLPFYTARLRLSCIRATRYAP